MTEAELNAAITAFRQETEDMIPAVMLQYYFNGGTPNYTPYTDTAQALAVIGANYKPYMMVNVGGVDHWFTPLGALVPYLGSISLVDKSVTMDKLADLAALSLIGNATGAAATPQAITIAALRALLNIPAVVDISDKVDKVSGKELILTTDIAKIHQKFATDELAYLTAEFAKKENSVVGSRLITETEATALSSIVLPQRLTLPASAEVSGRITGATKPEGWSIAAIDGTDLLITHTLTGRKIVAVNVFTTDSGVDRWLPSGSTAYSGFTGTATTVTIEGLTSIDLPLRIELIFS
jgi:hypothetical protein